MSSSMWNDLPPEVLEQVLLYLPVHVVCRFRLVCKAWNHLISQPTFASLRAFVSRQASSVLISPKLMHYEVTDKYWHVLDAVERRSYRLSDSFIENYHPCSPSNIASRGLIDAFHCGSYRYALAADGGFIYAMYFDSWIGYTMATTRTTRVHVVCNPVSKSYHEITEPELHFSYKHDVVVMSVDNVIKTYKIITMKSHLETSMSGRQPVYLYDSTTRVWRKLCETPEDGYCAFSSIFVNGVFYTLFVDLSKPTPWPMSYSIMLYSCDLATGAWSRIDADLPPMYAIEEKLQLVVSLGRLFLVEFNRRRRNLLVKLSIWEIVLARNQVVKVANMQNFSKYSGRMFQLPKEHQMMVAVGCADSIVISCMLGRCVKFDLLEKRWHELPVYIAHNVMTKEFGICAGLVDF